MQAQSLWLSVTGVAEIVTDRAKIDELWSEGLKVQYQVELAPLKITHLKSALLPKRQR